MARESWTDERLDDFKENVNQRFDQVERKMSEGFARVDGEIRESRQTMIHGFFVLVGLQATSTLTLIGLKFL